MDLSTIAAAIPSAFSAAKEAIGMAKNIREFTSDTETKTAMSELLTRLIDTQGLILEAQSKMQEITQYARDVERQLASYRDWDEEAGHYRLDEPYPGTFVYARKADALKGEPMHYLCPTCFQKRQKSFLQGGPYAISRSCNQCDVTYQFRPYPDNNSGGAY